MAVTDVEGHTRRDAAMVQSPLLCHVRVVVSGFCEGATRTVSKAGHGCSSCQIAILKG